MAAHIEIDMIREPIGMGKLPGAADMRHLQRIDACRDAPREKGYERIRAAYPEAAAAEKAMEDSRAEPAPA